jgi:DNA polymerase phi
MGGKDRKRARDPVQDSQQEEAPAKRRRQITDERLKLSKLYEDLSNESDEVRLEAAKELIIKFSPENKPSAKEVEDALGRLLKGLCSQRKAARVGFSLTLTELLRQIFGQNKHKIEGFGLDAASVIELGEEKTKVEGNVPGRVRLKTT